MKTHSFEMTHPIQIEVSIWCDSNKGPVIKINDEGGHSGPEIPLEDIEIVLFGDGEDCQDTKEPRAILAACLRSLLARLESGDFKTL